MHEMSVATSLVEEVLANLERLNSEGTAVAKVTEVHLEIGELAFISEMQLRFCFDLLCKEDARLAGAELTMDKVDASVRCPSCGFAGGAGTVSEPADHRMLMSFACPECGGTLEIVKGRGMVLRNISVEVDDGKGG